MLRGYDYRWSLPLRRLVTREISHNNVLLSRFSRYFNISRSRTAFQLLTPVYGFFLDRFGARTLVVVGSLLNLISVTLLALASPTFDAYIPGL
jgi:hypothetical protein